MGIPYTGSGTAANTAMDKIMTKRVWLEAGLPTPRYVVIADEAQVPSALEDVGLPMILKAPHEGSTLGIVRLSVAESAVPFIGEIRKFDSVVLAGAIYYRAGTDGCHSGFRAQTRTRCR